MFLTLHFYSAFVLAELHNRIGNNDKLMTAGILIFTLAWVRSWLRRPGSFLFGLAASITMLVGGFYGILAGEGA